MTTKKSTGLMDFLESLAAKKFALVRFSSCDSPGGLSRVCPNLVISRQDLCDMEHNLRFVSSKNGVH